MDKPRNLIPNQLNIDESNIDEWSRGKKSIIKRIQNW